MLNNDYLGYFAADEEQPKENPSESIVNNELTVEHQESVSSTRDSQASDQGPANEQLSQDVQEKHACSGESVEDHNSSEPVPDDVSTTDSDQKNEEEQSDTPAGGELQELELFPEERPDEGQKKEKQEKFNNLTYVAYAGNTILVSKLINDVESASMEDIRKKLERHYPELSKQRTKMEYDKNKNLIVFDITIGRKGAILIEGIEGYFTSFTELLENVQPINYLAAKSGHFEIRKNGVGTFVSKCTDPVVNENMKKVMTGIKTPQDECQEEFRLELPSIPYEILQQIVSFFSDLAAGPDVEATSVIYWDTRKLRYFADIPPQLVGKSFVDVKYPSYFDAIKIMEIHSHNTMHTYFSRTDNEDEMEMMIYGVVGCLQRQSDEVEFNLKLRSSMQGRFFNLQPSYIIDHPIPEQYISNHLFPDSNRPLSTDYTKYPSEWATRVKINGGRK